MQGKSRQIVPSALDVRTGTLANSEQSADVVVLVVEQKHRDTLHIAFGPETARLISDLFAQTADRITPHEENTPA